MRLKRLQTRQIGTWDDKTLHHFVSIYAASKTRIQRIFDTIEEMKKHKNLRQVKERVKEKNKKHSDVRRKTLSTLLREENTLAKKRELDFNEVISRLTRQKGAIEDLAPED